MPMFAIRHKPSGAFFPVFKGGQRRGSTHLSLPFTGMPRLFATKIAASNCLHWWLAGAYTCRYVCEDWGHGDDYLDERVEPKPDRMADDMEIVQVGLHVFNNETEGTN